MSYIARYSPSPLVQPMADVRGTRQRKDRPAQTSERSKQRMISEASLEGRVESLLNAGNDLGGSSAIDMHDTCLCTRARMMRIDAFKPEGCSVAAIAEVLVQCEGRKKSLRFFPDADVCVGKPFSDGRSFPWANN